MYFIIYSLIQTIFLGNQPCARDTGVKLDGCCLCPSGGKWVADVVGVGCMRGKHRLLE